MLEDVLEELDCPWCSGPRPFEVPPCADGHGEACPERVCTACSGALLLGADPAPSARRQHLAVVA
ncbi:hypothetical protein FHN55_03920 [Streptomyces sp. NP160]|uniref:hypothetical protein n=1 Tax=Streptomyces sp. NP160 TaxID=2586637 RepID=UPI00111964D5|nr:hypothetical protein [Streptomyces sp. NP160]TNM69458.1 hypothetical protein FHN55_03920 [Streptomyces sp. NP160]